MFAFIKINHPFVLVLCSMMLLFWAPCAQSSELDEITELSSMYDAWGIIVDAEHYNGYSYMQEYNSRIVILDTHDLLNEPGQVGTLIIPNLIYLKVYDEYLYAIAEDKIFIYSLANPASPTLHNTVTVGNIYDNYISKAYLSTELQKIFFYSSHTVQHPRGTLNISFSTTVFDISNPISPVYENRNQGYQTEVYYPEECEYFADEYYLYEIWHEWGSYNMFSIKIKNPETLTTVSTLYPDFYLSNNSILPEPLKFNDYLLLPTSNYLLAIDLSDSSNPTWVNVDSQNQTLCGNSNVIFNNNFYSFENDLLSIYDISNFPETSMISSQIFPVISGNVLCFNEEENQYSVPFRIETPEGNISSGLTYFTLNTDGSFEILYEVSSDVSGITNAVLFENHLFLIDESHLLKIVDVTDPYQPYELFSTHIELNPDMNYSPLLYVSENLVVVDELQVFHIYTREENNIEFAVDIEQTEAMYGTFALIGNNLLLLSYDFETGETLLQYYDLSDPCLPVLVDIETINLPEEWYCKDFHDSVLYVASEDNHLYRYDFSNLADIVELPALAFERQDDTYYYKFDVYNERINYCSKFNNSIYPPNNMVTFNDTTFSFFYDYHKSFKRQGNEYYHTTTRGINVFQVNDNGEAELIEEYELPDIIYDGIFPNGNYFVAVTRNSVKILQSDQLLDNPEAESGQLPETFEILSLYPNPFNSSISAKFNLHGSTDVKISVFNLLGREVVSDTRHYQAGTNSWHWNGKSGAGMEMASGIYLLKFDIGNQQQSRKIILLK